VTLSSHEAQPDAFISIHLEIQIRLNALELSWKKLDAGCETVTADLCNVHVWAQCL